MGTPLFEMGWLKQCRGVAVQPLLLTTMRPLTEDESKAVFTKLANYIVCSSHSHPPLILELRLQGKNLIHLIDRKDEPYCFRLHKDKVYYVSESSMRLSISVARPNLISLGTCFGKFSKTGKFKLHVTALDYIAQYAKYKVYLPFTNPPHLTSSQGLDQAEWRNALLVRQPRPQGTPRSNNRGYSRTPRRGCVQHE